MMNENAMTIVNGCDKDFYNGNACKVHFGSYGETKEPKYASLQEMGKLALNGGSYGRLNTRGNLS